MTLRVTRSPCTSCRTSWTTALTSRLLNDPGLVLEQPAEMPDDFSRPLVFRDDVVEDSPDFPQLHGASFDEPLGRLGVGEDRRQRLLQLVGERSGESAHR